MESRKPQKLLQFKHKGEIKLKKKNKKNPKIKNKIKLKKKEI